MKSRPILFSAPMVRALRDGSKTQTRRVVKGQQAWPANTHHVAMLESRGTAMAVDARRCSHAPEIKCPYGQPGDQLWVKESHEFTYLDGRTHCIYKADGLELPVDHPFGEAPACYKTDRKSVV